MLAPSDRLVVNGNDVAADIIDGEAIIMNLATGMYYSMDRVGAVVWDWVGRGHTVSEIAAALSARYDVSAADAESDLAGLVGQLLEEGLVHIAPLDQNGTTPIEAANGAPAPYQRPELNRYGDMAELLALDPPMPTPALSPWTKPGEETA